MNPAPPRAIASAAQAWDIMRDDVTLRHSLMTGGFNEQRQKDLLALSYEDRQRGNSGYYLHARVELEIRDTNERAQALYDACCEVWDIHGRKRDRSFYHAVFDNCLQSLFATRRATVTAELQQRDQRIGTPGNSSAASGSLARRMDQLKATWNQKLEKETRDSETRERVARERATLLPATQVQFAPAYMDQEGDARATSLQIEQVREVALSFTWRQLAERFEDVQAKTTVRDVVSATFTRTTWESGSVTDEWIVQGNPVWAKGFEDLATIAARKLGCALSEDAHEDWLGRVRKWMQERGLDKDKNVAWRPTGDGVRSGLHYTCDTLQTSRIAELSALFCIELLAHGTPESAVTPSRTQPTGESGLPTADNSATPGNPRNRQGKRPGRPATRDRNFQAYAGKLWLDEMNGETRVRLDGLKRIAMKLDASEFKKPSEHLEATAAKALRTFNRKNGNVQAKKILSWTDLVETGDKSQVRAMRNALSRCGGNARK